MTIETFDHIRCTHFFYHDDGYGTDDCDVVAVVKMRETFDRLTNCVQVYNVYKFVHICNGNGGGDDDNTPPPLAGSAPPPPTCKISFMTCKTSPAAATAAAAL